MTDMNDHHNLLVTYDEAHSKELASEAHTFLGTAKDSASNETVYAFLKHGAELANNRRVVPTGMDGIESAEDQSMLQAIASNFESIAASLENPSKAHTFEDCMAFLKRNIRAMQDVVTPKTLTVKLHYFKPTSGRLYQEAEYETPMKEIFEVFSEVRAMRDAGELPGLTPGSADWIIHIAVPGHVHAYPHILLPEDKE